MLKTARRLSRSGLVVGLLGSLLLALLPTVAQAQVPPPKDFFDSEIQAVHVNPLDNTVWVRWTDFATAKMGQYNLSHFSADGQTLKTLKVAFSGIPLTILFEAGATRFYYEEYNGYTSPDFRSLSYLDLETNQSHKVIEAADIPNSCIVDSGNQLPKQYYNPARNQFYLPCSFTSAQDAQLSRTAVIDLATGKLVKIVQFRPMALHPDGGKFYAYREYYEKDSVGYQIRYYDLVLVDDQSLEITADKPLIQHQEYNTGYLSSFQVNSKTGLVYLTTRFCYAKCQNPKGAVFDRTGKMVVPFSEPKVSQYEYLNEATNQLYGPDEYAASFGRNELAALDGSNVTGDRLAQFYWRPLAFDTTRNLVYATQTDYKTFKVPGVSADLGLGLLVVNGATNSVLRFIQVRPPDQFYVQKYAPSQPPPDNFEGRYFQETQHTLTGKFFAYWQANGGLDRFGMPITEPFEEFNPDIGKVRTVQYFERTRFELHPELAGTFYEVQLGLLGHTFSALTGPRVNGQFISGETSPVEGGVLFKETGHTLTGKFLEYWQANGGLARHGLPLTQPTSEVNPIDGKTYLVQYFERSRLELHPEFAGTRYEVEMGLLGVQTLRTRGWSV